MASPSLSARLRLLRGLDNRQASSKGLHRYSFIRVFTQGITFAILYGVAIFGLARFDLWGGRHMALGKPTDGFYGVASVLVGVGLFYVITFALNIVLGRIFCGFGCPVGEASRIGDAAEIAVQRGEKRIKAEARLIAFSAALGVAAGFWLVSPRVFVEGSVRAIAVTVLGFVALSGLVYLHGRYVRWKFCKDYCPIGIYYSAVQTDHGFGIHFDEPKGTCKDCNACSTICPVDLHPRDLNRPKDGLGGFALDGFPETNHCLTCGACVRACEDIFRKDPSLVPLRLSRH